MPGVDAQAVLLLTVGFLTVYTAGIGATTAVAIGVRDAWRRRPGLRAADLDPRHTEVVLAAPALPAVARFLMVTLNAFYFTAMQGMGEHLVLTKDGFRMGPPRAPRIVRWVHVTDFMGAHIGAFRAVRMSEGGEWQDPRVVPNVIFYRLNQALVRPRKTVLQRLTGLSYFDGVIRNRFGVSTQELMQAMRAWQRLAVESELPPLRRPVR